MCVLENKIKWNHSSGGGWKQNCNQALALACKFCMCLWLLLFWLLLCESEPNDPVETDQNAQHCPCRIGLLILLPCCFFVCLFDVTSEPKFCFYRQSFAFVALVFVSLNLIHQKRFDLFWFSFYFCYDEVLSF